jgi:glycosyltransferase involved in cell wall biosynthesis
MPAVSILIPVYQGSRYLEASLRSVFAQSFEDFDVTVVDDASSDGSPEIARRVADECGGGRHFRLIRNDTRQGLVGNWNRCLELSTGTYVLIFHQDDILDPGMLQRAVAAFEQHPDVGFVYSGYRCIDSQDRDLPPWSESSFVGRTARLSLLEALMRENFICCPSVVVPRAVYDEVGRFDTRFVFSADMEMWLRIAARRDVFCCPEIGVRYRLHDTQVTELFRNRRRIRSELEYLTAAFAGLQDRRHEYPDLWRRIVRDSLWAVRQHAVTAPLESWWALGILARRPGDVARAIGDAVPEKSGLRARRTEAG